MTTTYPTVISKPMLFSGPMILRLLDGSKTMTRRLVKRPLIDPNFGCELAPGESKEVGSGEHDPDYEQDEEDE